MQAKHIQTYTSAFTLIELLIVVAIIAIISGIAIPNMLNAFYQSKDKKTMTDMRNFAVAIGIYRIDREMVPNTNNIHVLVQALQGTQVDGQTLQLKANDSWGHNLYYWRVSDDDYTLKSYGRDGIPSFPATTVGFDPNNDTILISGAFAASHQGTTIVVGH